MEGKNVILHIFMCNVKSDFSGARLASEQRVKCFQHFLLAMGMLCIYWNLNVQSDNTIISH